MIYLAQHLTAKTGKHAWKLKEKPAQYVDGNCGKYILDKDLKDAFMGESPVPKNVESTEDRLFHGIIPEGENLIIWPDEGKIPVQNQ